MDNNLKIQQLEKKIEDLENKLRERTLILYDILTKIEDKVDFNDLKVSYDVLTWWKLHKKWHKKVNNMTNTTIH